MSAPDRSSILRAFVRRFVRAAAVCLPLTAMAASPDVVLEGRVTGRDHQSYRALPFRVPSGVERLSVTFRYDREAGATIDLGLEDPQRFRGWSGGNKSAFTVAETDATPSYLPGPLPADEWRLVLGMPHVPEQATVAYRAEIRFARGAAAATVPFAEAALLPEAGWYRGDLHLHSGHSDGACTAQSGARVPCPLYRTLEAAAARGLDFVAITEHNARSHHQELRTLQAAFDRMVLIPGMELTTFRGHANVLGTTADLDFRRSATAMEPVLRQAGEAGGLIVINHPGLPSDARCMGCGWQAEVPPGLVAAVEVVNGSAVAAAGGRVDHGFSGVPWWERLLDGGVAATAVAASDNHDPDVAGRASAVGWPVTAVYAEALSQPALLEGIRRGRVFVDLAGTRDRLLEMEARSGSARAQMGGRLVARSGARITVTVRATNVPGSRLVLVRNGQATTLPAEARDDGMLEAVTELVATGERGWIRPEVVSADGEPLLLGNPVYLNFPH